MKTFGLWIAALLCLSTGLAEAKSIKGNGKVETRNLSIESYNQLEIKIQEERTVSFFSFSSHKPSVCLYSQQGNASLQITLDENLFEHIVAKVMNGKLLLATPEGTRINPTQLQIKTGSQELTLVNVSRGMDFQLQTPFKGTDLTINASGGSDIRMEQAVTLQSCLCNSSGGSDIYLTQLTCDLLETNASGGSDVILKGKAKRARMNGSGGSDIKAYDFLVNQLDCNTSGGSDAYVYAVETLNASASGGSDIHYKGTAQVHESASGGSDIDKED